MEVFPLMCNPRVRGDEAELVGHALTAEGEPLVDLVAPAGVSQYDCGKLDGPWVPRILVAQRGQDRQRRVGRLLTRRLGRGQAFFDAGPASPASSAMPHSSAMFAAHGRRNCRMAESAPPLNAVMASEECWSRCRA